MSSAQHSDFPRLSGSVANDNQSIDGADSARDSNEPAGNYDFFEVPAAVVCAACGDADCPGCQNQDLSRSGIVSLIAWERDGALFSRLWDTARLTTRNQGGFFELLPDGHVLPAFRFALACELIASAGIVATFALVALVVAPHWLLSLLRDQESAVLTLKVIGLGIPAMAILLVMAHAVHGLGVDVGAKRHGSLLGSRTRALRFGLYAAGWDLVIGPVGFCVVAAKEGLKEAFGIGGALAGLPKHSSLAFLRGAYRMDGEPAAKALFASYVAATVSTLVLAFAMLFAIVCLSI